MYFDLSEPANRIKSTCKEVLGFVTYPDES